MFHLQTNWEGAAACDDAAAVQGEKQKLLSVRSWGSSETDRPGHRRRVSEMTGLAAELIVCGGEAVNGDAAVDRVVDTVREAYDNRLIRKL